MGDVIIKLARMIDKNVGKAFPWKNFEEALKARAMGLYEAGGGLTHYDESSPVWKGFASRGPAKPDYRSFDEMWEKLKAGGFWFRPNHNFGIRASLFKTPTGKFEFFSSRIRQTVENLPEVGSMKTALERLGIGMKGDEAFMPHYEAPPSDAEKEHYPLLMMPYELINLASGWVSSPPYLYKTLFDNQLRKKEAFVELNPQTAAQYGLEQGDRVGIQSQRGGLEARVNLFEGAMPGVVYVPLGLGHTAYDAFQQGKGINPNDIIVGGKDPLSGQAVWWNTRVKLIKI
jgi:anaerobic selenocysteine-containing dehydrogenase